MINIWESKFMKDRKIGLGIVACSNRMQGLLKGLPGLGDRIEIRAIFDPDRERSEGWRQDAKCPDADLCGNYAELLRRKDIDWVAISSWNALHAGQAVEALEAGKHVFCEKPLATSLEDARRLREAADKSDRLFLVGFTLRYSSFYRKLKETLYSGVIGKVISMEFNETLSFNHGGHIMACWRRLEEFTGSHILEKCCHDIDVASWLIGSRASRVASFGGRNFFTQENSHLPETLPCDSSGEKAYCQWPTARGKNPFLTDADIVDNQVAILEYANGVRATFHTNLNAGIPERRFYILGSTGALRGDMLDYRIELGRIGFDMEKEEIFSEKMSSEGHGGADEILCSHWADLLCGRTARPLSTVTNGLESAVTCFAIEAARKTNQIVDVNPYWERLEGE